MFIKYCCGLSCKPRASGDDPGVDLGGVELLHVNPARAGMIPCTPDPKTEPRRKPRASGDDPSSLVVCESVQL